jgi:hypothetical protein
MNVATNKEQRDECKPIRIGTIIMKEEAAGSKIEGH